MVHNNNTITRKYLCIIRFKIKKFNCVFDLSVHAIIVLVIRFFFDKKKNNKNYEI